MTTTTTTSTTYRINWAIEKDARKAIGCLKQMGATYDPDAKTWTKTGPIEPLQRNAADSLAWIMRYGAAEIVEQASA